MATVADPLDRVINRSPDCSAYKTEAEREKCLALSDLAVKYKADFAKLQEVKPEGVFSKLMKLNQYRDQNWSDNYQVEAKKGEIKKIEDNLNQVVKMMGREYDRTAQVANVTKGERDVYDRISREYDEILGETERRADAAEDKIILRDRLVSINRAEARWKDLMIYLLKAFSVVVLLMVPVMVGYWSNAVTTQAAFGVFAFLFIVYLIYVSVEIYYVQGEDPSISARLKADLRAVNHRIYDFGQEVTHGFEKNLRKECAKMVGDPRDWSFNNPGYLPVTSQV